MEKQPLYLRLYSQEPLIELTRAIGYRDVPLEEGQSLMQGLIEKFGKDAMKAASDELVEVTIVNGDQIARLKPNVRQLAHQLLGPAPECKQQSVAEFLGLANTTEEERTVHAHSTRKAVRKKKVSAPVAPAEPIMTSSIMDQYKEAKERHPGMLLLFRMGDFYELFGEDAEIAAKLLGLTLTSRDKTLSMAGFPHHQLEAYLKKLLNEGKRVAICEQVGEPTEKGRVPRAVTRVATSI